MRKMAAVKECVDVCSDVVAVLPAGGSGIRMNLQLPKQVKIHIPQKILDLPQWSNYSDVMGSKYATNMPT